MLYSYNIIVKNMQESNFSQRKSRQLRQRSSSARNIKTGRELQNQQYFGQNSTHLVSKQSKQYHKVSVDAQEKGKNSQENNQYIKNLYKKYLGKENQNKSERKQKMDSGVVRNLFGKENKGPQTSTKPKEKERESIVLVSASKTQGSQGRYQEEEMQLEYCNSKYSLTKNKEPQSVQLPPFKKISSKVHNPSSQQDFYSKMMNEDLLQMMGDTRSSLILCMKEICKAKRIIRQKIR